MKLIQIQGIYVGLQGNTKCYSKSSRIVTTNTMNQKRSTEATFFENWAPFSIRSKSPSRWRNGRLSAWIWSSATERNHRVPNPVNKADVERLVYLSDSKTHEFSARCHAGTLSCYRATMKMVCAEWFLLNAWEQNAKTVSIDGLNLRGEFTMDDTANVEENDRHALRWALDLLRLPRPWYRWVFRLRRLPFGLRVTPIDLRFVSGDQTRD